MNNYFFTNKDLFRLLVPLMAEQSLEFITGLADSIMVASVGEAAVSGVSLTNHVMAFVIWFFIALAAGGSVIASQYIGKARTKEASETSNQLVWFVGISAVVVTILIYAAKPFILDVVFGDISENVRQHAYKYLMIVAASIPFVAVYNAGAAVFRSMGNTKLPMKIMIVANILNIAGNALFIYGFKMGVTGAAIATVISYAFAAVAVIALVADKKLPLHINKSFHHKFEWKLIKKIMGIGIPYGVENGLFQLGRVAVLSLVSTFGTAAITANAVAGTLAVFLVMPGMAMNVGLTVVIARSVGAGDYEQAKYYNKKIIGIIYASNLVMNIFIVALLPLILGAYHLSEATAALTIQLIIWHIVFGLTIWPLAYSLPSAFRAAGDAKYPMEVGVLSMIFCRIVMAYVLGKYFGMGVVGAWFAMFIDWFVKAALFIYRYMNKKWMRFHAV